MPFNKDYNSSSSLILIENMSVLSAMMLASTTSLILVDESRCQAEWQGVVQSTKGEEDLTPSFELSLEVQRSAQTSSYKSKQLRCNNSIESQKLNVSHKNKLATMDLSSDLYCG